MTNVHSMDPSDRFRRLMESGLYQPDKVLAQAGFPFH